MAVIDDIKTSKGYIMGVVTFASAVGAFLTQIMHFKTEPTIITVACFAVMIIYLSWLIDKSEKRQLSRFERHREKVQKGLEEYDASLNRLIECTKETQLSTLRMEMSSTIYRTPENHDTILKYAEKYFVKLGGDWVQTDVFLQWANDENKKGRPVHIPMNIMSAVSNLHHTENTK